MAFGIGQSFSRSNRLCHLNSVDDAVDVLLLDSEPLPVILQVCNHRLLALVTAWPGGSPRVMRRTLTASLSQHCRTSYSWINFGIGKPVTESNMLQNQIVTKSNNAQKGSLVYWTMLNWIITSIG